MAGGLGLPVVIRRRPRADASTPQQISVGTPFDFLFLDPLHQLRPTMTHPDQTKPHH